MTKQTGKVSSKLLGLYQLAVGVIGLIFLLYGTYLTFRINLFFFLYSSIMIGMLSFCAYTGYKCLTDTTFGLQLTFYNQLFQFAWVILSGFQFSYSAGIGLFIGVNIADGIEFFMKFKWFVIRMGKANPEFKRMKWFTL